MKRQNGIGRYGLFAALLLVNLALLAIAPETGRKSLALSMDSLVEMLTILPPVFVLMGLMDVWIPKKTMTKYLGKGAGVKGGALAFMLGSFSAGPLYAAYPMAAMFLKKGASLANVFLFLGAWSTTKIPMMMFEVTQMGARFTALRFALNLAGVLVLSLVMEKTTGEAEYAQMVETACAQMERR